MQAEIRAVAKPADEKSVVWPAEEKLAGVAKRAEEKPAEGNSQTYMCRVGKVSRMSP